MTSGSSSKTFQGSMGLIKIDNYTIKIYKPKSQLKSIVQCGLELPFCVCTPSSLSNGFPKRINDV